MAFVSFRIKAPFKDACTYKKKREKSGTFGESQKRKHIRQLYNIYVLIIFTCIVKNNNLLIVRSLLDYILDFIISLFSSLCKRTEKKY